MLVFTYLTVEQTTWILRLVARRPRWGVGAGLQLSTEEEVQLGGGGGGGEYNAIIYLQSALRCCLLEAEEAGEGCTFRLFDGGSPFSGRTAAKTNGEQ